MLCWAEIQSWNRDKANKCVWEEDVWPYQHTLDNDKLGKNTKNIQKGINVVKCKVNEPLCSCAAALMFAKLQKQLQRFKEQFFYRFVAVICFNKDSVWGLFLHWVSDLTVFNRSECDLTNQLPLEGKEARTEAWFSCDRAVRISFIGTGHHLLIQRRAKKKESSSLDGDTSHVSVAPVWSFDLTLWLNQQFISLAWMKVLSTFEDTGLSFFWVGHVKQKTSYLLC